MDRTNCPAGFATDHVFLYGDDFVPGACDANVAFFVSVFAAMSVVRITISIIQFIAWRSRERLVEKRTGKKRRRWPVFPVVSSLQALVLCLFTILASLNIANAANGFSGFLLGLFYTPLNVAGLILLMRLVRLGRRLIPMSRKVLLPNAQDSNTPDAWQELDKADLWLKGIFFLSFLVGSLLYPISLIIIGPIIPVYATLQAGSAALFANAFLLLWGMSYQYQRLINAVKATEYPKDQAIENRRTIQSVLWKMRAQQVLYLVTAALASILWILVATKAVLPRYWYTMLFFSIETAFTGFSTYSMAYSVLRANKKSVTLTPGDSNKNAEAVTVVVDATTGTRVT